LDEGGKFLEAVGRDVDEKEQRFYAVASRLLLIGRSHGRDENATWLEDGKGPVLRLATDRVEHDIDVGEQLLEPRRVHVNDPVRPKRSDVREIVRERGRDYLTRNPPRQLHGIGAH